MSTSTPTLEAARAVLDGADDSGMRKVHQVWLCVDRAAWLAWQAAKEQP